MGSEMLVLRYEYNGNTFFLRGTVWTSDRSRAAEFQTEDEAMLALANRYRIVGGMGFPKKQIEHELATAKTESKE